MLSLVALVCAVAVSLVLRLQLEQNEDLELSRRFRLVAPILTGLAGALLLWRIGLTRDLLITNVLLVFVLLSAACNTEVGLFPDQLTIPGILLGCLLCPWLAGRTGYDGVLGALAGGGTALLLRALSRGGVGLGDVKMLAMIGAFVGPGIKPLLLESFVLLVVSIPCWLLLARGHGSRALSEVNPEPTTELQHTGIPTGPAYAGAVLVHVLFAADLTRLIQPWPNGNAWW